MPIVIIIHFQRLEVPPVKDTTQSKITEKTHSVSQIEKDISSNHSLDAGKRKIGGEMPPNKKQKAKNKPSFVMSVITNH